MNGPRADRRQLTLTRERAGGREARTGSAVRAPLWQVGARGAARLCRLKWRERDVVRIVRICDAAKDT